MPKHYQTQAGNFLSPRERLLQAMGWSAHMISGPNNFPFAEVQVHVLMGQGELLVVLMPWKGDPIYINDPVKAFPSEELVSAIRLVVGDADHKAREQHRQVVARREEWLRREGEKADRLRRAKQALEKGEPDDP